MIKKRSLFFLSVLLLGSQVIIGQPYFRFSPDSYAFWKEHIQETNQEAYDKLLGCEESYQKNEQNSIPCIVKTEGSTADAVYLGEAGNGYPILVFPSPEKHTPDPLLFARFLTAYNSLQHIKPISPRERQYVLDLVKQITPELYTELKRIDPKGFDHVKRYYASGVNAGVEVSKIDGLPIFSVTPEFLKISAEEQRFILGHELGHYVLKHFIEVELEKNKEDPFKKTFKLAFNRNQEYEADRFAVVDLGFVVKIDKAIAFLKNKKSDNEKDIAFEQRHPLYRARINHLDELRREVELQQNRPRKPINWEQLAQDYLEFSKQQK